MKAYLCMNPCGLEAMGLKLTKPADVVAVLCVYRTKKAARAVHGKKATLSTVNVPDRLTSH